VSTRAEVAPPPSPWSGAVARYDHRSDGDYYSQPGALYRLMSPAQQQLLVDNLVAAMGPVPAAIQARQLAHFRAADATWGARVEAGLAAAARPLRIASE
jgi:catalase